MASRILGRTSRGLAAAFLLALTVPAQDGGDLAHIRVDDLVGAPRSALRGDWLFLPRLDPWRSDEDGDLRRFQDEAGFVAPDDPASSWMSGEGLVAVLREITGLAEEEMRVEDGVLLVSRSAANAVQKALGAVRSALPGDVTCSVVLERTAQGVTRRLVSGDQFVREGDMVVMSDLAHVRRLTDFNVEIAAGSASGVPVVEEIPTGAAVALRVRRTPDHGFAIVETMVRVADAATGERLTMGALGYGGIERIVLDVADHAATRAIPQGGTTTTSWSGPQGESYRLTIGANWSRRGTTPGSSVIWSSGLWSEPLYPFGLAGQERFEPHGSFVFFARAEDAVRAQDLSFGLLANLRAGFWVQPDGIDVRTAENLRRGFGSLPRYRVSLLLLDVPDDLDPNATTLPDTAREIVRLSSSVLAGESVAFTGRQIRSALTDWSVEIAMAARLADPVVRLYEDGYALEIVADGNDTGPASVAVDCALFGWGLDDTATVPINRAIEMPELTAGGETYTFSTPALKLEQDRVSIEQISTRSQRIATRMALDVDGRASTLRSASRLLGERRAVWLRVQATPE
jgi:hypothetical protein